MSKGSKPRPFSVSVEVFSNNFDSIFGKKVPIVTGYVDIKSGFKDMTQGYESCKESDTTRTDAAKNRALVNR